MAHQKLKVPKMRHSYFIFSFIYILPKYCIGKIKIADITWEYYFNG